MEAFLFEIIHWLLLLGILVTAFLVVKFRQLLSAIISLTSLSLLLSLEFYLLQAPDVAIAEASIGAGLTMAIFIITMRKTNGNKKRR